MRDVGGGVQDNVGRVTDVVLREVVAERSSRQ